MNLLSTRAYASMFKALGFQAITFFAYFLVPIAGHADSKLAESTIDSPREQLLAVIEIPAGTTTKFEFQGVEKGFSAIEDGGEGLRKIEYLPYPGNYGFIPGTCQLTKAGGDGDPLDVLVITDPLEVGSILPIIPIALLRLVDGGEDDHKLIAIPADVDKQTITLTDFSEFDGRINSAFQIIESWFLNYKREGGLISKGWSFDLEEIITKHIASELIPKEQCY